MLELPYAVAVLAIFYLIGTPGKLASLLPTLQGKFGYCRLKVITLLLAAVPIVVIAVVAVLYLFIWRSNLLLRFAHMTWVLSLWITGTLSWFGFSVSLHRKISSSFFSLLVSILAIQLAIYLTPLSRYQETFEFILLPFLFGIVMLGLALLVLFRIRKFLWIAGKK